MKCMQPNVEAPVDFEGDRLNIQYDDIQGKVWVCIDSVSVFRAQHLKLITIHEEPVFSILEEEDLGNAPSTTDEVEEDEYVKYGGSKCPNCGTVDIEGIGELNADGDWMSNDIKCNNCGARWTDIYTLSGYDNLEVPESPALEPQSPTNH